MLQQDDLTMIEFFSGIGGMRLAVQGALDSQQQQQEEEQEHQQAEGSLSETSHLPTGKQRRRSTRRKGISSCQAYDISLYANQTYAHNFYNGEDEKDDNHHHHHHDHRRKDVVSTKLVEQLRQVPLADLWTLSPPCQPFTTTQGAKTLDMEDPRCAGLKGIMKLLTSACREGEDETNPTHDTSRRSRSSNNNTIHRRWNPKWILLENVQGFATSQMCDEWKKCLRQNKYGYREYLLSPIQFGIPNHRLRYYILCEFESTRWNVNDENDNNDNNDTTAYDDEHPDTDRICREPLSHQGGQSHSMKRQLRTIGEFVDMSMSEEDLQRYIIPTTILEKPWSKQLGIVGGGDRASHCFTAGYGRILSRSTGSLFLFRDTPTNDDDDDIGGRTTKDKWSTAVEDNPIDRTDMLQYYGRLRKFTPQELLRLFGFPTTFSFPPGISQDHQYKLVGNSINIVVVTELMKILLLSKDYHDDDDDFVLLTDQEETTTLSSRISTVNDGTFTIGGTKGHIEESIGGILLTLYQSYRWKPIPNCTGRYTCREHTIVSKLSPLELLASVNIKSFEDGTTSPTVHFFDLVDRADRVWVVPLDTSNETGIITFEKRASEQQQQQQRVDEEESLSTTTTSYVHTLNTPSGFRRKLNAIGILEFGDGQ